MRKIKSVLTVVVIWLLLSALLLSQYDFGFADTGKSFDSKVNDKLKTGGTVTTQIYAIWELQKYKETQLIKKYPFKYAPWESYVAIDKYVTVECRPKRNAFVIDSALYDEIKPTAERTKAEAKKILKRYKVKGKTKADYLKIRKYIWSCEEKEGIKSALGFFQNNGGDCAAHASAVYVLCKVQGIPVRWVMGSYDGYLHAWNQIKVGGKWYYVDETFGYPMSRKLWSGYRGVMVKW